MKREEQSFDFLTYHTTVTSFMEKSPGIALLGACDASLGLLRGVVERRLPNFAANFPLEGENSEMTCLVDAFAATAAAVALSAAAAASEAAAALNVCHIPQDFSVRSRRTLQPCA